MTVKPVILTKGTVKIAIYGIGNIKDERLHEVFLMLAFTLFVQTFGLVCGANSAQTVCRRHLQEPRWARRFLSMSTYVCCLCCLYCYRASGRKRLNLKSQARRRTTSTFLSSIRTGMPCARTWRFCGFRSMPRDCSLIALQSGWQGAQRKQKLHSDRISARFPQLYHLGPRT